MQYIETTPKLLANMGKLSKKPLYKCISERLMHVTTWYHWTPGPKFTKVGEEVSIGQITNMAKFHCVPTKSVLDIPCGKILLPKK